MILKKSFAQDIFSSLTLVFLFLGIYSHVSHFKRSGYFLFLPFVLTASRTGKHIYQHFYYIYHVLFLTDENSGAFFLVSRHETYFANAVKNLWLRRAAGRKCYVEALSALRSIFQRWPTDPEIYFRVTLHTIGYNVKRNAMKWGERLREHKHGIQF